MEYIRQKLTQEILLTAVGNEHGCSKDDVKLFDITFEPGSKKGEGFACEIAAVTFEAQILDGPRQQKNFIVKYGPGGPRGEMLTLWKAFDQEGYVYTSLIPMLQKLRHQKSLKRLAFPKCFYSSVDDQLLIMENLKAQGFRTAPKQIEPLTINEMKLILEELSALHATSYHFINNFPGGISALAEKYPRGFVADFFNHKEVGEDQFDEFMLVCVKTFQSAALVAENFGSAELGSRMRAFQDKMIPELKRLLHSDYKISFVTHGDAWYNNFLFRYSDKASQDPSEIILLDLQNTRLGRAGMELAILFCISLSTAQRKGNQEVLLKHYYEAFKRELEMLGSDLDSMFSFETLMEDYNDCFSYGFMMGGVHSQVLLVGLDDSSVELSFETFKEDESSTRLIEKNEREVLAKAAASPAYRQFILGLAEEAAERNII